jgi:hypothetical protein
VVEGLDPVARYAMSAGLSIRPRTVLVEGTSDVDLFEFAARLELKHTGVNLVGGDFAIVAAGQGDRGGTPGVVRELISLRAVARTLLLPNGKPRYRVIALFDNDKAGRLAVKTARDLDTSILEYKDIFRLRPVMPMPRNLDPKSLERTFDEVNEPYKGLEWELEDVLPQDMVKAFLAENPNAVVNSGSREGMTHRDFSRDGKARLHRFVKLHAIRSDVQGLTDVLKALRFYLGLK